MNWKVINKNARAHFNGLSFKFGMEKCWENMDPDRWTEEENQIFRNETLPWILNISYMDHISVTEIRNWIRATAGTLEQLFSTWKTHTDKDRTDQYNKE